MKVCPRKTLTVGQMETLRAEASDASARCYPAPPPPPPSFPPPSEPLATDAAAVEAGSIAGPIAGVVIVGLLAVIAYKYRDQIKAKVAELAGDGGPKLYGNASK